jgi:hypothetical protein
MKKYLCVCLMTCMTFGMQQVHAKKASAQQHQVVKNEVPEVGNEAEPGDAEGPEPDTTGSITTEFECELGNKVTMYENAGDPAHIALRWKRRVHRLTRVGTSTGANRFENRLYGLIWIGIPAKSMLLDSKKNRQLANECRSTQQMTPP